MCQFQRDASSPRLRSGATLIWTEGGVWLATAESGATHYRNLGEFALQVTLEFGRRNNIGVDIRLRARGQG